MLTVNNLTVERSGQTVLDDVSFHIPAGAVTAIIGPNGSGKTTLLRAILGFVPSTGSVEFDGKSVVENLGRIGYVPQRFSFDASFPITVREFVRLSHRSSRHSVEKVLGEVGLPTTANQLLGRLSGGQIQRILIARAIMDEPALLLLDEATAGVDVAGERGFYDIIEHLSRVHNTTIVLVSHELSMIHEVATQVICLNRRVVWAGPPDQALKPEQLKKLWGQRMDIRHHGLH